MNGDTIAEAIHAMARQITFYREPAGEGYPGEVIQSPTLTLALNGGDCDDIATVVATAAAVLGCEAAIGWYPTSSDGSQLSGARWLRVN
jgi:transglutaminase-like putative cysteine protease